VLGFKPSKQTFVATLTYTILPKVCVPVCRYKNEQIMIRPVAKVVSERKSALKIQRGSSERSPEERMGGRRMRMEYKNKTQQMTVRCGVIHVPLLEPQNCMQYS
jgi:hypothetical protein